jgi:hypothetical protein
VRLTARDEVRQRGTGGFGFWGQSSGPSGGWELGSSRSPCTNREWHKSRMNKKGRAIPGTSGNDRRSESRVFQNCPKAHKTTFPRPQLSPRLGPLLGHSPEQNATVIGTKAESVPWK